jgi:hypothetical protein
MAQNDSVPEMMDAIFARLLTQWDAWKNRGAAHRKATGAADGPAAGHFRVQESRSEKELMDGSLA